ncbi:hypothetical protein N7592_01645 [Pseudomonas juntendi]|uniref:DUF1173 family protein n=1 Tax=Pseudomonas juntendi TaxID=2666183 RepID=A0ABD4YCZ6_9PSED|nr:MULTISPECIES: hypothetical protein [Pseudomonas]MDG9871916.1 hypothetical protein [Pseudomonas juntendi]MDH0757094.1 hypothetical protein [Pseudomonas juntendi]MDH1918255.1 hypothetical protein [Pseudomonas juntendi]MDH2012481.1 hypothetical protein [Pseudomonas juntendi]QDR68762.1 hypothetical protein FPB55_14565 [Pseudomonas sp. BJP69]
MRIIDKTATQVRSLTPAEEELLVGFATGTLGGPRLLQANQLLMNVRNANQWLACDCRNDALPVLNVTLNGNTGTLFLKNNPGTAEHAPGCPFSKDEREAAERENDPAPPAAWLPPDTPLRLIGDFRAGGPGEGGEGSERRAQQRLLALLLTWIETSGLNLYATHLKKDLTGQFAELRSVASRYPLLERVPASNYLETRLDMKHMMMLKARLREAKVFGNHRRHGLLLDCVDKIKGRKLFNNRNEDGFDFQGHHLYWGGSRTSGPLLALMLYSPTSAGSHYYELIHVASVPVLSRAHLFPVYRDEEREPLKALVSLVDWMASKGVKVQMRRPVIGGALADELVMTSDQDRVLSISLLEQPLGPEPDAENFKRYADFKSPETFRKFVAGFFMRER